MKPVIAIDDDMVDRGIDGLHDAADINFAGDMDWKGMMRAGLTAALDSRYFEADGYDDILGALESAERFADYIRQHKGFISDEALDEWALQVLDKVRPAIAKAKGE